MFSPAFFDPAHFQTASPDAYFDGCYFDPTYFDATDCSPAGGAGRGGRVRILPTPEDPDELLALF